MTAIGQTETREKCIATANAGIGQRVYFCLSTAFISTQTVKHDTKQGKTIMNHRDPKHWQFARTWKEQHGHFLHDSDFQDRLNRTANLCDRLIGYLAIVGIIVLAWLIAAGHTI
jgi:hypothetical protein